MEQCRGVFGPRAGAARLVERQRSWVSTSIHVERAKVADLPDLVPLFGEYREFYKKPADPLAEERYLHARLSRGEAVVFIARAGGAGGGVVGFTLLYPTFASVSLAPAWILNDLYVSPAARRGGVARALMEAATGFARSTDAVRIELRTQHTNTGAQALYDAMGWTMDEKFRRYSLSLK